MILDVQFKAKGLLITSNNEEIKDKRITLPYLSSDHLVSIQTHLNPEPTNVALLFNGEAYHLYEKEPHIFIGVWNQTVKFEQQYNSTSHQHRIDLFIPEVTRMHTATANITFENKIGESNFEFQIQVGCPTDGMEFCLNHGTCQPEDISCNCDGTGFYGDIYQYTCTLHPDEPLPCSCYPGPDKIEGCYPVVVTGSDKLDGIYTAQIPKKSYRQRDGQKIIFKDDGRWKLGKGTSPEKAKVYFRSGQSDLLPAEG